MLRKIAFSQMLALALLMPTFGAPTPVCAQQQMDAIGTLSPASTEYKKKIVKEVAAAWVKSLDAHWKISCTATIAIMVGPSGDLSAIVTGTTRNAGVDRVAVDCVKKAKVGPPPANWNPEQKVYMYLKFKVANTKNLRTPGHPGLDVYREGLTALNKKDYQKSIELFSKAVQIDPLIAAAHANLGFALYYEKRYNEAIQSFKESLRVDPEDDEIRFIIAKTCLGVNDSQDAKKYAAEVNPSSKYYSRAQDLLAGRGEFASAANTQSSMSSTTSAVKDDDATVLYKKAVAEATAKNYPQAVNYFKQSLALEPSSVSAHSDLAATYMCLADAENAEKELKVALQINPNDAQSRYLLGGLYINTSRVQEGLPFYKSMKKGEYGYEEAQKYLQTMGGAPPAQSTPTNKPNQTTIETVVTKNSDSAVKDKWALVIGVSKFANPQYNLKYAAKDAQDFYNYLITEGNFKKDHVLLLLNENATRRNIMAAFGDKFLPAVCRDGDLVTIYISTHGTPASKDPGKRNFIIAYDTEAESLYETGVDMDELYRRVKEGVQTSRALIVMDTCYSGAGVPGARGVDEGANFDATTLAQGSGHLVMTSSSPSQRSWESKVTPNGVFTKYLIQNLKLTKGHVKNSFDKLKDDVGWEVQNAFNQQQQPQIGGEWEGKDLILNAIPTAPRQIFNPDLTRLINLQNVKPAAPRVVPKK